MNTNNISLFLDIALSLTFFYFLSSMFVSGLVEFFNTIFEKRAAFLQKSIEKLQGVITNSEQSFWNEFKNNPFIKNLEDEVDKTWKLWGRKMSYLDSSTFISAIMNMLGKVKLDENTNFKDDFEKLKKQIENFGAGTFQEILQTLINESIDLKTFETKLANWFNQYMEHVSGWFKRYVRLVVMLTALIVTIILNLNTIVITQQLSSDKSLRNSIVAKAVNYVDSNRVNMKDSASVVKNDSNFYFYLKQNYSNLYSKIIYTLDDRDTSSKSKQLAVVGSLSDSSAKSKQLTAVDSLLYSEATAKYLESNIQGLGLKIGYVFKGNTWGEKFPEVFHQYNMSILMTLIGWILTTAALSFGAPFWFDLLVKLVNVRNVMKKPDSK